MLFISSMFYCMTLGNSQVINTLTNHGSCHPYKVYFIFPSLLIKSHQLIPVSQGLCELAIQSASGYVKAVFWPHLTLVVLFYLGYSPTKREL